MIDMRSWLILACGVCLGGPARGQLAWTPFATPMINDMAFDSLRDRLVVPGGASGITHEFDGTNWWAIPAPGGGNVMAFDPLRGRVVAMWPGMTQEWDGVSWSTVNTSPTLAGYHDMKTFHAGRGRVVCLSPAIYPVYPFQRLEMYEWGGSTWTNIPSQSPLTITQTGPGYSDFTYSSCTYDPIRDKLMVFGRGWRLGNQPMFDAFTWEWDATSGWIQYPPSGPLANSYMWFDQHRGVVVRATLDSTPVSVAYWDPMQGWSSAGIVSNAPAPLWSSFAYDGGRNRLYYVNNPNAVGYLHDTAPAAFEPHGAPCVHPNPPDLRLSAPWRRAWIGDTLEVTASALPLSMAFLAMGFSDQSYGSTSLPLDLAIYGMPGCHLRVAPEATVLGAGTSNTATFAIPIPNSAPLVGVTFWQQVFAPSPGANPAGMLGGPSVRGTVGRAW